MTDGPEGASVAADQTPDAGDGVGVGDGAAHILVVDDDDRLRDLLRTYLANEGFRVTTAGDAAAARRRMELFRFDLLVLDIMMPGESGLDLTRQLRAGTGDGGVAPEAGTGAGAEASAALPILMLTAMGETEARIEGLEAGADDYLPKPFEPRELVLRIHAILRRTPTRDAVPPPNLVRLGACHFDLNRDLLLRDDRPVRITTTEAALLKALAGEPGRIMSREELTDLCAIAGGDRTVDVQVTRLRRKIEPDARLPQYLQTVRGRGYVLRPD